MCVSLSLCLSLFLSLSVPLSFCLCLSVCLSVCLSLSPSLPALSPSLLSLSLLSLSLSLSLSLALFLSFCLSVSLSLPRSLSKLHVTDFTDLPGLCESPQVKTFGCPWTQVLCYLQGRGSRSCPWRYTDSLGSRWGRSRRQHPSGRRAPPCNRSTSVPCRCTAVPSSILPELGSRCPRSVTMETGEH